MDKHAFIVTGLGFGDEGKGMTTHWLACRNEAHTVVRTGGPQALHHVVTKSGKSHVFSQFGSGTLRGSATHLSSAMLVDPPAVIKEGEAIEYEQGIRGVFDLMTAHEDALVISPFQAIAGRIRELVRGKHRRGSVGIGVGETMHDAVQHVTDVIRIRDIGTDSLRAKLLRIQARKCAEFEHYADRLSDLPPDVRELVQSEFADLARSETVDWAIQHFTQFQKRVRVVDTAYVAQHILGVSGTVVFEGSQGVLLDKMHGFHPFTTQVRTTPASARAVMRECDYDGDVQSLGVLRAYHTRHGGGPFVTEQAALTTTLPDMINGNHRWQGSFRVGYFDAVAARYALAACGIGAIDGIVLTCVDRLWTRDSWDMCQAYTTSRREPGLESLFDCFPSQTGSHDVIYGIKAGVEGNGSAQLARQEKIGAVLATCKPIVSSVPIADSDLCKKWVATTAEMVSSILTSPVVAVSVGQTEADKIEMKSGQ